MKATVFGATGFIGSHIAKQLKIAGNDVTALVRKESNTSFLKSIEVKVIPIDFNVESISNKITEGSTVYNAIASDRNSDRKSFELIEIELTKKIIQACSKKNIRSYIQLSSIISYGHILPDRPINENYTQNPKELIDIIALEREQCVIHHCNKLNIPYIILQPVSTIGPRERQSAFGKTIDRYINGKFPIVDGGHAKFSSIDTRDIGRAMVYLGEKIESHKNETYLLKGFDTSWIDFKKELDLFNNSTQSYKKLSFKILLLLSFILKIFSKNPIITKRMIYALGKSKLYDDSKIRNKGFNTIYSLKDAIKNYHEQKEW